MTQMNLSTKKKLMDKENRFVVAKREGEGVIWRTDLGIAKGKGEGVGWNESLGLIDANYYI